ncbi:SNF2-related N-terminal domain [Trinorchestia longiramus]|nr:SNF2-related N-terminal domain [Trinorchestia longiramus]
MKNQKRSLAPSQVQKRLLDGSPHAPHHPNSHTGTTNKRSKTEIKDNFGSGIAICPNRVPLTDLQLPVLGENSADSSFSAHEARIRQLLARPFKPPLSNYSRGSYQRSLGLRRSGVRKALHDPDAPGALVLFTPPELSQHQKLTLDGSKQQVHVVVDPLLCEVLRPHQREGVAFMYDCVTGVRIPGSFGCIMADEMGLGKTLQCITLLWTLLKQGSDCTPIINKAMVVCPSSLVKCKFCVPQNWHNEINKWLRGRLSCMTIDSGSKEDIDRNLRGFAETYGRRAVTPVLIISYETFRLHAHVLHNRDVGLILCDEGHRLKNSDNLTYQALMALQSSRRVLLSGILGTSQEFRKRFENPILQSRDADACDAEHQLGKERLEELTGIVNRCLIRRTNELLSKYLPVKYEFVVCCPLSSLQRELYTAFVRSASVRRQIEGGGGGNSALTAINSLKKLCNHPDLLWDKVMSQEEGYANLASLYPPGHDTKFVEQHFKL